MDPHHILDLQSISTKGMTLVDVCRAYPEQAAEALQQNFTISKEATMLFKYLHSCIKSDGYVKVERNTGWANYIEMLAQKFPIRKELKG